MRKPLRALLAGWMVLLLLSCGGGANVAGDPGGVGTGGTGIVAGVVSGLGSVIVEGTRYDESQAALESRPDLVHSAALALADLHIGQYAYLQLDASGTPKNVRIESQFVGPAAGVNTMMGRFSVWGQQVLVNRDATRGPVTVFSGYASLADMRPGDAVQIYGVLQSGDAGADVLLATRVERLAAAGVLPARVTGTLQPGGSGALLLAGRPLDASSATNAPTLAAGVVVTAVVPWTANVPSSWQASAVALLAPQAASTLRVSGAVHLLAGGHALVQGVDVDLSSLPQAQRDQVREGSYVTVAGQPRNGDGSRVAASEVDALPQGGQAAQLHGSITAITGSTTFVVRGQAVDASGAQFTGGTAANLAVGMYVDVQGQQGPTGVIATQVALPAAPPVRAVLEISGTVQSVDAGSRIVTVQTRDGTIRVAMPSSVALPGAGQVVGIAGYWDGSTLQAREYEQDGSPSN